MSKKKTQGFKKKKQLALVRLVIFIVLILSCLLMGQVILSLLMAVLAFVINEVLFADHIFYDPKSDYLYGFDKAFPCEVEWSADDCSFKVLSDESIYDTALLAVQIKHTLAGKFVDPYVTIKSADIERKQYFERSVAGLRYINISEFINTGDAVCIEACHCQLVAESSKALLFSNASLKDKKILVIAPHADDAEIAAFGLYSKYDSAIVTLTAGEVDAKEYESKVTNSEEASLLKGRLRSWDSIAIPQWAGVDQQEVVQLGYFCMQLKTMHDKPDEVVSSKTAGVSDTRVFREFNKVLLKSDTHGTPSWNTLVTDLVECIDRIKPHCIVMPHLQLDPHLDHHYSTLAVKEALLKAVHKPDEIYLYANHLVYSDMFPFGAEHTLASLPPNMEDQQAIESLVSIPLTIEEQKNKALALGMMHDLQTPLRWKKKLRFQLQAWLIGRPISPYGEDEFFRKAIRSNELFYVQSYKTFTS